MNQTNDLYCHVTGKVKHKSPSDAHKAVRSGRKAGPGIGSTYKCAHCNQFHHTMFVDGLTKKKANDQKNRRNKNESRKPPRIR